MAPLREPHQDALGALVALFEGHAVRGGTIGELADLGVPLTQAELAAEYAADRANKMRRRRRGVRRRGGVRRLVAALLLALG